MKYDPKRYDPQNVKSLITQLSELCDPVALMGWLAKRTKYGDKPGPEPWTFTRAFFADYNAAESADRTIALFEAVGVHDEVDAGVWLAEHESLIP